MNEEVVDFKSMGFRYGIAGFDASDSIDLTSAKMLMMRPGDEKIYEMAMYWIPESVIEEASDKGRKERDGVPYQQWIARGLMRTVPGNVVPKSVFQEWLEEVKQEYDIWPFAVGYDPWHMDDTAKKNLALYVGEDRAKSVRQGAQTLSDPMKRFQVDLAANRIVDNHNPLNEWCRLNVQVKEDINSNIQPVKKGLNPKNRIDGLLAEIDAYTVLLDMWDDYQAVI